MPYRSPYEAYPFLADESGRLECDFELLTDEIASLVGVLRAELADTGLRNELARVCELVYHANPTLRTCFTVTREETGWLKERMDWYAARAAGAGFVLPLGTGPAATAHLLRVRAKCLVRLLYRHMENGGGAPDALLDFANLLSGYFFQFALWLNKEAGEREVPFTSRNYR